MIQQAGGLAYEAVQEVALRSTSSSLGAGRPLARYLRDATTYRQHISSQQGDFAVRNAAMMLGASGHWLCWSTTAWSARRGGMTTLDSLHDQWAVLLTTFRRDGTPVGTPVSLAVDAGRGYVRSPGNAWKVKRLRNDPHVEVAPCTPRGRPTGPAVAAVARRLEGEEARRAAELLRRRHPSSRASSCRWPTGCCGVGRSTTSCARLDDRPVALEPVHGGAVGDAAVRSGHADVRA